MPVPSGAALAMLAAVVPLAGAVACFLLPRLARTLGPLAALVIFAGVAALAADVAAAGAQRYRIGGWGAPLGIDLHVDGLTVLMLLTAAVTGLGVSIYARAYFPRTGATTRGFWPLWLLLWAALDALFVSADLFNLYVTLELLGLSAVALVALAGTAAALTGAMRYLLVTFLASLGFLLGVALIYHTAGTLDIRALGRVLEPGVTVWLALGLMTAALLMKSALFPMHFWLPPAHSSAPAPVSAVLSALVVAATVYLLLRLWLEIMPGGHPALGQVLAGLGAAAIVWGSLQALRQRTLKLLVAYSTVAQLGYLFLPFAIRDLEAAATAWRGVLYFVLVHAMAKAAMFMAVGNVQKLSGHDRIHELDDVAQRLPVTMAAFGVAGVTIVGLPPSGGFVAKWLLLHGALSAQQWWIAAVVLTGGLLSAAYVFKVVGLAFTHGSMARAPHRVPGAMEWVALSLALATLALGVAAMPLLAVLESGTPFTPGIGGGP